MGPFWALADSAAAHISKKPEKNAVVAKARRSSLQMNSDAFKGFPPNSKSLLY
jgi:hypothetical protein